MEAKKDPILRYIAAVCFIGLALLNLSKFLTYTLQQIAFLHKTLHILVIYALWIIQLSMCNLLLQFTIFIVLKKLLSN